MAEREIKISFGTLFEPSTRKGVTHVVIRVGESGGFGDAQIGETDDGKKWFYIGGSNDRNGVRKIIGQMSPREVIEAAERGARHAGVGELPKQMRDLLEQYSRAKPRLLK